MRGKEGGRYGGWKGGREARKGRDEWERGREIGRLERREGGKERKIRNDRERGREGGREIGC